MESETVGTEVIAMNLTIAALEGWMKNGAAGRSGEELGREIGALYREIYSAVDEMSPADEDEDEDEEYEDEDEDEEPNDERD